MNVRWKTGLALVVCFLTLIVGAGYFWRGDLRDHWRAWASPKLPPAIPFVASGTLVGVGGSAASSSSVVASTTNPLAWTGILPKEKNLDVPFMSQAPRSNWDAPYQEACEEASMIMVDAYYRGRTDRLSVDEADRAILELVAYEEKKLGYAEDITAQQVGRIMKDYFGYPNVIIQSLKHPDQIKQAIALGYPVILPAAGQLLGNPNFRNGGPPYHMIVIRGYTPTLFITNDPGTRNGKGYTYSYETIMKAAHDWTGNKDTIRKGPPMMMVVIPHAP